MVWNTQSCILAVVTSSWEKLCNDRKRMPCYQMGYWEIKILLVRPEVYLGNWSCPAQMDVSKQRENARITRWFLQLQDFQFKVEHRAGNSHANADAMSRRPAFCRMYRGSVGLWVAWESVTNPTYLLLWRDIIFPFRETDLLPQSDPRRKKDFSYGFPPPPHLIVK